MCFDDTPPYDPPTPTKPRTYVLSGAPKAAARKPDGWHTYHICGDQLRELVWSGRDAMCAACGEWFRATVSPDGVDELTRELTARLAMVNHIAGEDSDCTGDDGRPWCDACWESAVEFLDPAATFALAVDARAALAEPRP